MDYFVTKTVTDICTEALVLLNVVSDPNSVPGRTMERTARALNVMLKSWDNQDIHLYRRRKEELVIYDGEGEYEQTDIDIHDLIQATITDEDGENELPIRIISRDEYMNKPNKTVEGRPVEVYFQRDGTTETLTFWPVPDGTYLCQRDYREKVADADEGADLIEIPDHWIEATIYCLAQRLIIPFGKAGTPSAQMVIGMAKDLYDTAACADIIQDGGGEVQFVTGYRA